jgi:hypothetical protein
MKIHLPVLDSGTRVRIRQPRAGERSIWVVRGRVVGSGVTDPAYDLDHERTGRPRVLRRSGSELSAAVVGGGDSVTRPTPTGEQQAIIDAYQSGADLVIEAGAGTGKTSTLRLVAATQPRRCGLYVAYNKAIASDANRSFPASVTCVTAHSLARLSWLADEP